MQHLHVIEYFQCALATFNLVKDKYSTTTVVW